MSVYAAGEYGADNGSTPCMAEGKDGAQPAAPVIKEGNGYGQTLTTLLNNLQGLADDAVIGAGLARFSTQRLITIRHAAERKVDSHLHAMGALLQVMTLATREFRDRLPPHVMTDIAAHLQWQTQEMSCWRELVTQATYMHGNPDLARSLAQRYMQQAETLGEWPKG